MSGEADAIVWEFSKNGSILMGSVRGRYKFGDQNRIKIETPFATTVYLPEISGDRMILREPGGPKARVYENKRSVALMAPRAAACSPRDSSRKIPSSRRRGNCNGSRSR
jgi:hypothetical protein